MNEQSTDYDAGMWRGIKRFLAWYFRSLFDFPTRRPYPTSRDIPPEKSAP